MKNLDVLIIYNSKTSISASVDDSISKHPFLLNTSSENYLPAYSEFLETCARKGLSAGFSTATDVIAPGTCSSYWTYSNNTWSKHVEEVRSFNIFDKFSASDRTQIAKRALLLSDPQVVTFNTPKLFDIFFDKLLTYDLFTSSAIPSVSIVNSDAESISSAIQKLQNLMEVHRAPHDFNPGFVLKDRYGASGNHVYLISENFEEVIQKTMDENDKIEFILQPFLAFDSGFSYKNVKRATDIRLIFHNNKILQSYFRLAKDDEFRCNEHKGGELIYVSSNEVPDSIKELAQGIVEDLNSPGSLYALDFLVSNSGNAYFLEGNYGPGIDWNPVKPINKEMSQQLIQTIVDEFYSRVHRKS